MTERLPSGVSSVGIGWMSSGFLVFSTIFFIVYQFSGIAAFQSGRFVALGTSTTEILLSPIMNPKAFWGQLFLPTKAAYLLSLALPLGLISLWSGWRFLLATALPFLVLLVWDHVPATCLAFQYASVLLPVMWVATLQGSKLSPLSPRWNPAFCALVSGLVLSIFVGQLPISSPSILGAIATTYGKQENARGPDTEIGQWLNEHVESIANDGSPVLATSRIAAHLVGNEDLETVGQYLERRPQLAELEDRKGTPILHYHWIFLDQEEGFQQSVTSTSQVLQEALRSGFQISSEKDAIIILRNTRR